MISVTISVQRSVTDSRVSRMLEEVVTAICSSPGTSRQALFVVVSCHEPSHSFINGRVGAGTVRSVGEH